MKRLGGVLLVLGLSVPAAAALTLITSPFWRWFEEATGIESFGHSGPAGWCFWFNYVICAVACGFGLARRRRQSDAGPKSGL